MLAAVCLGLWLALPVIAERVARGALEKIGFDKIHINNTRIGLGGVTIKQADLHQNDEKISARNIAVNWHGLNPMDIQDIAIESLSLPLYLSDTARPLGMDLNLPATQEPTTGINLPDIRIGTAHLQLHYDLWDFEATISDVSLIRQDSGEYKIASDIRFDDDQIEGTASLNGHLRSDPLKSWTDYTGWAGDLNFATDLKRFKHKEIKDLNDKIKAKTDLTSRQMDINTDFNLTAPMTISGKTAFNITADAPLQDFTINGQIDTFKTAWANITDAEFKATYNQPTQKADFNLSDARITPLGAYQHYPAFQANLSGDYKDRVNLKLDARDIAKNLSINAAGAYMPAENTLDINYQLALPQGLSPKIVNSFFPDNNFKIQSLSGDMSLSGEGKYVNGIFIAAQDIKLENITGMVDTFLVEGVNGVLELHTTPEISLEDQEIFIGGLNAAGLPLQEGLIRFDYEGKTHNLRINTMNWSLAGGYVSAEPFTMDITNMDTEFILIVENMAIPQLLQLAPVEGLEATGTVNGRIPVSLRNGAVSVSGAKLAADTDGVIRYNPAEMPGFLQSENEYIAMLREALKNYNYDTLSLSLSGEAGKEQTVILSATGANPDFYDGRPVNLNLNLEGDLDNLVKFNLGTYSIPDRIQKQLENFEAQQ